MRRIVGRVAAGGQDDEGAALETSGDFDAVDVGQAHVEQDEIGPQPIRVRDPIGAGRALTDHVEPVGFEQGPGGLPESGVIIDYEDGLRHTHKMPQIGGAKQRGTSRRGVGQPHPAGVVSARVTGRLPEATMGVMDVDALYARHRDALLVFLVRRTADAATPNGVRCRSWGWSARRPTTR